jgi:serine phosphatase RsbU (regulator of sigma subunit)
MKLFLIIILLISIITINPVKSQTIDTTGIRKLFLKADDVETRNPDSSYIMYKAIIDKYEKGVPNTYIGTTIHRFAELDYIKGSGFKLYFERNFKSIKIFESINDSSRAMQILANLARALAMQSRFREALHYIHKAYGYSIRHNYPELYVSSAIIMSDCYSQIGIHDSALAVLLPVEKSFPKEVDSLEIGVLYNNIGNAYCNSALYLKSAIYADKALSLFSRFPSHQEYDRAFSLGLKAVSYLKLGKLRESEKLYLEAIEIFERLNQWTDLNSIYREMTELEIKLGNKEGSLTYFMKHDSISTLIYNESNSNSISEMKTLFETEKKEQQNKALMLENNLSHQTIQKQRIITFVIIGGLVLISVFAIFILRGLKQQRRANLIISNQKKIVEQQKELVEEHQKEILDSIHYAKRIQNTLLAHQEFVDENLPNNFILFQPKDIVSGDFYWATKHGDNFYLAVCDSTGHGVPGAFMSLLNIGFLNEAIKEKNILKPNDILNYVRKRLIESIGNDGQQDGMDSILICIETYESDKIITYAAANNKPVVISDNLIIEHTADKMPVGKGERTDPFTLFQLNAKTGDMLYLYTDGFADQFGGPKGKKFKYKQLNELLLNVSNNSTNEQNLELISVFEKWKGELEQVDDVLLVGIRI